MFYEYNMLFQYIDLDNANWPSLSYECSAKFMYTILTIRTYYI